jgi:hypothetical protein
MVTKVIVQRPSGWRQGCLREKGGKLVNLRLPANRQSETDYAGDHSRPAGEEMKSRNREVSRWSAVLVRMFTAAGASGLRLIPPVSFA